jgi:predicted SnoaL-like aldol condensation-catalyzing enzyme
LGRVPKENEVTQTIDEKNKAFVLEAFETLFNKRDYAAAERFWSPNYIQHSAHIPPGREGLFGLVKGIPDSLHYENGLAVANGNYVLLHGRFTGIGLPANWIVADIVRLENGQLAEHWDVVEDEATKEASSNPGNVMPCAIVLIAMRHAFPAPHHFLDISARERSRSVHPGQKTMISSGL